jgi:ABC-type nitrate/sulfonate/bicarbonate transport system substrate-binding protein
VKKIPRRIFLGLAGATLLGRSAGAADKIIGGTLGGQAPLWPIYVAAHKGFFAGESLDVQINFAQSGAAAVQQITAGSLDVVLSVGVSDPVHAVDKGAALAIIRIIGRAAPYVLIGKPELKTIDDLKGKIVSVGQNTDITTSFFERMAAAHGLKRGDFDELVAGVAAARYAALRAGVADAAFVLPPINFQASRAGYVTLGYAADYVKDLPFTAMAVRRPWAQAHLPVVKRLLAAIDASMAWLADDTHRGEAVDLLVEVAHSNKEDTEASYDLMRRIAFFEPSSKLSRTKLENVIAAEKRLGNIDQSLTLDRLIMPGVSELME